MSFRGISKTFGTFRDIFFVSGHRGRSLFWERLMNVSSGCSTVMLEERYQYSDDVVELDTAQPVERVWRNGWETWPLPVTCCVNNGFTLYLARCTATMQADTVSTCKSWLWNGRKIWILTISSYLYLFSASTILIWP